MVVEGADSFPYATPLERLYLWIFQFGVFMSLSDEQWWQIKGFCWSGGVVGMLSYGKLVLNILLFIWDIRAQATQNLNETSKFN